MTRNSLLTLGIATTGLALTGYYRGWFHGSIGKTKKPTDEKTDVLDPLQKPGGTSDGFEQAPQSELLI